jgi:hypothetical protein
MKRMKHPEHGFHDAYSSAEEEALRARGWVEDDGSAIAAKLQPSKPSRPVAAPQASDDGREISPSPASGEEPGGAAPVDISTDSEPTVEELRARLDALGVSYSTRWGAGKLQSLLDEHESGGLV